MILHLIRHAQALERSREIPDEQRCLTCRGRKRFRQVATALRKLEIDPDAIFTSPKIRAVQTADILAEALRFAGELLVAPALGETFTVAALRQLLLSKPEARELVVVGHEPDLGALTAALLQLDGDCTLTKGSVVTVETMLTNAGMVARLQHVVTGGGRVIRSRGKALERLQVADIQNRRD
jgi:phosphohistidine phosphatase